MSAEREGRSCPIDYRYSPSLIAATEPCLSTQVLYVAGGLYGNPYALDCLEAMVSDEPHAKLIFNGDFHWFDAKTELFSSINNRVAKYSAIAGNVEKELARTVSANVGCGCAYPEAVDQAIVDRSNRIHKRLQSILPNDSHLLGWLRNLPNYAVVEVAGRRVAVVHGDATSLAGWGFEAGSIDLPEQQALIQRWLVKANVDAFASSHTCQAVCRQFQSGVVINNGAAGMPNFNDGCYGIITRIAQTAGHRKPLYSTTYQGLVYEALPLFYDQDAWTTLFLSLWPEGSDAWTSYWDRIEQGSKRLR
ncbi:metallophosphoesterase family protein [Nitrincola nitratireducens]|uniref:Calcineurin-like phosphoesterase superfamily domain protein n=1 Tax=Nitrincola nitratireducens TaxID=1229521 RepID=W9V4J4_9GAMM|nr:metallophosphoesterase family protein [Nitrincola nitratireducens]EXJ11831.1 Calcineurin-like phosphoesterase superfamily domain protein [Nitrincola nitratireducens]